jgi:hypothetical protein
MGSALLAADLLAAVFLVRATASGLAAPVARAVAGGQRGRKLNWGKANNVVPELKLSSNQRRSGEEHVS